MHAYAGGLTRQLVLVALALGAIEVPVAHLLLSRWNDAVAVAVTAASVALLLWILVDWIAAVRRPIEVGDTVVIPRGLRRRTVVRLDQIAGFRIVPGSDGLDRAALRTLYGPEANVVIDLSEPLADGRTRLAVGVDHPAALIAALEAVTPGTPDSGDRSAPPRPIPGESSRP